MKYRKKEPFIEALQFIDEAGRIAELSGFIEETFTVDYAEPDNPLLKLPYNLKGREGDYVIKDSNGRLSVMSKSLFEGTYELVIGEWQHEG